MKRIYIIDEHSSSKQNGIGTYINNLTSCLRNTFDVTVLSFNDDVLFFTREIKNNTTILRFPTYGSGAFFGEFYQGMTLLRLEVEDSCDNIFIVNHFLCNSLLLYIRKYYPKTKIVFVIHDQTWTGYLNGDDKQFRLIVNETIENSVVLSLFEQENEMYQLSDMIVCLNNDTKQLLLDVYGLNSNKVCLIPNGLCLEDNLNQEKKELRKKYNFDLNQKILLYVGRTTYNKGFDDLLAAFEKLLCHFSNIKLLVAGDCYRFKEIIKSYQRVVSNIVFYGQVDRQTLKELYKLSDIGIIPSHYEQCSYTGIEMMAVGLPIVASNAFGIRCMFEDNKNAIVASLGDRIISEEYQQNIVSSVSLLFSMDKNEISNLCENAQRQCLERYSSDKMKEKYIALLKSL